MSGIALHRIEPAFDPYDEDLDIAAEVRGFVVRRNDDVEQELGEHIAIYVMPREPVAKFRRAREALAWVREQQESLA